MPCGYALGNLTVTMIVDRLTVLEAASRGPPLFHCTSLCSPPPVINPDLHNQHPRTEMRLLLAALVGVACLTVVEWFTCGTGLGRFDLDKALQELGWQAATAAVVYPIKGHAGHVRHLAGVGHVDEAQALLVIIPGGGA